ncbi:MAG: TolC family protein [Bacteroidales bacterium]|nr:TolC family protein [Bacteroidales bacterium]
MRIIILLIAVVMAGSCSASKKCIEPQITLPDKVVAELSKDSLCLADLHWTEIIADTILRNLIDKTLENNKDLLSASAKVQELEKLHRVARADQFPSIGAEAYIDRESYNYSGDSPKTDIEVTAKLNLSWEIDFFGRLRHANREALAEYLESIEGQRAMQITLISQVAISYFELIALDSELEIISRTLETREEDLNKARLRFEGGLTSEIPYQQAQVEYATTASLIPDLLREIEMKENEISLLAGELPGPINRAHIHRYNLDTKMLQVGIPSDLLKRRPDIRAAEQGLKGAMENVGYAWADRFPRFVISLEGGLENNGFEGFFASPLTYMIGELTSPVFSFGKRKAKYEAAIKAYDAQRFQYEKKVLQAFKEVNDAVISYTSANKTVELMQNLKDASRKYVDLALFQHINGHISYIDVLDAQRSYLNAEIDLTNAVRDEYIALIELYKALGGGWKGSKTL